MEQRFVTAGNQETKALYLKKTFLVPTES